jgi:hypothetical protein
MSLNIKSVEDANLLADANFEEWLQKFEAAWQEPINNTVAAAMLSTLPPDQFDSISQTPAFEDFVKSLKRGQR